MIQVYLACICLSATSALLPWNWRLPVFAIPAEEKAWQSANRDAADGLTVSKSGWNGTQISWHLKSWGVDHSILVFTIVQAPVIIWFLVEIARRKKIPNPRYPQQSDQTIKIRRRTTRTPFLLLLMVGICALHVSDWQFGVIFTLIAICGLRFQVGLSVKLPTVAPTRWEPLRLSLMGAGCLTIGILGLNGSGITVIVSAIFLLSAIFLVASGVFHFVPFQKWASKYFRISL